jgi:hypothetical protein
MVGTCAVACGRGTAPNTALHLPAYSLCFAALRSGFRQQVSLGVIATQGRILYCWTRQGGCDPAMVSCHLFPP